jgi:3-phenylpropionate/trans-cinnamate dioxygenase ferredoxin component
VAATDELPVDSMKNVRAGAVELCLAHAEDGEFYALNDVCTHEEFNLSDGELWGLEVECPQHSSRFDLRDGHVTGLPAVIPAQTYPVTVEGGDVYVEV